MIQTSKQSRYRGRISRKVIRKDKKRLPKRKKVSKEKPDDEKEEQKLEISKDGMVNESVADEHLKAQSSEVASEEDKPDVE